MHMKKRRDARPPNNTGSEARDSISAYQLLQLNVNALRIALRRAAQRERLHVLPALRGTMAISCRSMLAAMVRSGGVCARSLSGVARKRFCAEENTSSAALSAQAEGRALSGMSVWRSPPQPSDVYDIFGTPPLAYNHLEKLFDTVSSAHNGREGLMDLTNF